MSDHIVIIAAAVVLLAYMVFSLRVSRIFQSLRLDVAEKVEELLDDESIPEDIRRDLDRLAESMFSKARGWLFVLLYPVGVFHALRGPSNRSSASLGHRHERAREINFVYTNGLLCMTATSPICLLVFAVEVFLLTIVFLPIGRGSRKALRLVFSWTKDDRDSKQVA